ncbi:MAG: SDR family NAD(P)-dependent oxidoreductase [Alphaproteobacteria bacterium]
MAQEADLLRMFTETDAQLGVLDCLVYNAGVGPNPSRLVNADWADLRRVMDVNLLGAHIACAEAIKRMSTKRGGKGGNIVLMGSRASYYGGARPRDRVRDVQGRARCAELRTRQGSGARGRACESRFAGADLYRHEQ